MLNWRTLAALALGGVACAAPSHPGDPGDVTTGVLVDSGRVFEISAGQEVRVRGTSLTIRFIGITEDSRCPTDVQCVWAGNAAARFAVSASGAAATDVLLNTTVDPRSTSFAGYRITLAGLKPPPRSGTTIPAAAYVAALEVAPLG